MARKREKFSSQASSELLTAMRQVAEEEGRHFRSVLEEAMRAHLDGRDRQSVRPAVMAHFRASLERNRGLYELLAR